jgi:hypothetical protein
MRIAPHEGKELLVKNTGQDFADCAFGQPCFVGDNSERDTFVDHLRVLLQRLGNRDRKA